MTSIQKLTKAIDFISKNGRTIKDFTVIDGLPYKITGYFHDYHKGTYEITEKEAISEERANQYLSCPSMMNTINAILVEQEDRVAKQLRLANFYASEEF